MAYARHKCLRMPINELHKRSFEKLFKGHYVDEIHRLTTQFLDESLMKMINPLILARLRKAQLNGNVILILSSSPDFLVKEIAKRLGVTYWQGTIYQANSIGKFASLGQVMEGTLKAEFVKNFSTQVGVPLTKLTVYSDSYLDLPLLSIANHSIAVNPDSRLKHYALKMNWEII